MSFNNLFTRHPASVGETYFEHFASAAGFSAWMALAAAVCLVHAVLPFTFLRTGSRIIARLHDRMLVNRAQAPAAAATQ